MFKQLTMDEKHALYVEVFGKQDLNGSEETPFTVKSKNKVSFKEDRPALIVSSTSWTADEDFDILLNAVIDFDKRVQGSKQKFQFIVTGKGDRKAYYEQKMKELEPTFTNCSIRTAWLAAESYPKVLACSDLGVCLHYSSSGVDLPMKVVDMFGSALPVCAIDYETLPELVKRDQNGLIFHDSKELATQFQQVFADFPKKQLLQQFSQHLVANFQTHRWNDEWDSVAKPIFSSGKKQQ